MLISVNWLKDLLPQLKDPPEVLAQQLTSLGLEVEGFNKLADTLDGVVVGHVRDVQPHPKADRLKITKVFDGTQDLTVVCGAPNVAEDQKVALAQLGTTLPNGLTMEPRKIRGVASEGMLCAADELGLSGGHDGILVLEPSAEPGQDVADVLGINDVILELGITPNRSDAFSHVGIARELAALNGYPLPMPEVSASAELDAEHVVEVRVDDVEGCRLYAARLLKDVKVGPSPNWVQDRLRAVNQRPISNVVDATNIVLMELGQPLHAFDLSRLRGGKVVVRRGQLKEQLTLLDGKTIELDRQDLVIADAERAVALAGVMGGANSEVTVGDDAVSPTTTVLLEAAWFEPKGVRRTSKRLGLHTEASHRFERGVDPDMVRIALDRCASLIAEWADATIVGEPIVVETSQVPGQTIPIRPERASALLGRSVDAEEVQSALGRLGLKETVAPASELAEVIGSEALWFEAPSWRHDLVLEADLIEEVGRLGGYDAIPSVLPPSAAEDTSLHTTFDPEVQLRRLLVAEGFLETVSLAFTSPDKARPFVLGREPVLLKNPLGEESRLMRPSLFPALLEASRHNQDQLPSIVDLHLFELGVTFAWGEDQTLPEEKRWLGIVLRGRRHPRGWSSDNTPCDIYDLKGVLERVFDEFKLDPEYAEMEIPYLHPRSATAIRFDGNLVGQLGELHPSVAETYGLEGAPVFLAELDVDVLSARMGEEARHKPLPKLPPAQRDLSFFIKTSVPAARAVQAVRRSAPEELESVRIFDVYEGKGVPEGMKSIALELIFRSQERTLSDADVEAAQADIVKGLKEAVGAQIRDG